MATSDKMSNQNNRYLFISSTSPSFGITKIFVNGHLSRLQNLIGKTEQAASFNSKNQADNLVATKVLHVCVSELHNVLNVDLGLDVTSSDSDNITYNKPK